jgi:CheY-like chemotaxis protein
VIDLRDPATRDAAGVHLWVFSPDLATVVHASPRSGVPAYLAHMARIAPMIAVAGPATFHYSITGLDGVERSFDAHVVVPVGNGRAVVVEVWPRGPEPSRNAPGPHPELAVGLAKLDPALGATAALDTYLHCMLRAAGTTGVAALRLAGDVALVVAVAGGTDLVPGRTYSVAHVRAAFPEVLASAEPDDDHVILGGPAAGSGSTGWLGGAALRAARSPYGSSHTTADHRRSSGPAGPTKVVYLDDDPGSLELLVEFFRLLPSLELVPVKNEREAHDAVVVDAWLGARSAEGLVREILGGSHLEVPAVVILSADANASTVARFRRLGITSYLSKPIDLGHLFTVVDALARGDEREEGNGSNARTIAAFGN